MLLGPASSDAGAGELAHATPRSFTRPAPLPPSVRKMASKDRSSVVCCSPYLVRTVRADRAGVTSHEVLRASRSIPSRWAACRCIRGLRIPVATVVGMVADDMTEAEILSAYPDLEHEDLAEALSYAADAVRERELPLVSS